MKGVEGTETLPFERERQPPCRLKRWNVESERLVGWLVRKSEFILLVTIEASCHLWLPHNLEETGRGLQKVFLPAVSTLHRQKCGRQYSMSSHQETSIVDESAFSNSHLITVG